MDLFRAGPTGAVKPKRPIFRDACGLRDGGSLEGYLKKHHIEISPSFGSAAGVVFSGTPGHSVQRIKAEQDLFEAVRGIIERPRSGIGDAPAVLAEARQHLQLLETFPWAFEPAESLLEKPPGSWRRAFGSTFLAPPVFASVIALWLGCAWLTYVTVFEDPAGFNLRSIFIAGISLLLSALGILVSAALLLGLCFWALRYLEDKDHSLRKDPGTRNVSFGDDGNRIRLLL